MAYGVGVRIIFCSQLHLAYKHSLLCFDDCDKIFVSIQSYLFVQSPQQTNVRRRKTVLRVTDPLKTNDHCYDYQRHRQWRALLFCLTGLCLAIVGGIGFSGRHPVLAANGVKPMAHGNADVAPGCLNLVEGGTFEQFNPSWEILASTRPPMYSSEQTFNASLQSMRLGNGSELPNGESVSEVRHKPILLPVGATRIILRFLYYPLYDDAPGADLQQADLFDASTDQLIGSLLNVQDNARTWKARDFDLTLYAGRTISLRFRVRNDGAAGRTLMYIENVELEYCALAPLPTYTPTFAQSPTNTPLPTSSLTPLPSVSATLTTPTPVATITPIPVTSTPLPPEDLSCPNILVNGGFEGYEGWHFGEDPVPPRYTSEAVQEGTRAVLLGNPPENPNNVVTFSSVRQLVTLPFTSGQVQLRWWRVLRTAQTGTPTSTTDRQDLILLAPDLKPIQILRRELRNDGIWQEDVVDLTAYRGQTLYIYFNAFNDGNNTRTLMVLDNVRLRVCGAPVLATTLDTPIAIPLQPNLTTAAPLVTVITPSETPTVLLATATLPPAPTDTAVVATLPPPVLPTATPLSLPTATSNVYALPTLPTQTVIGSPTALVVAPVVNATNTPITLAPLPVASQRPVWVDRLGAIGVLLSILVVIGFIVAGVVQRFSGHSNG